MIDVVRSRSVSLVIWVLTAYVVPRDDVGDHLQTAEVRLQYVRECYATAATFPPGPIWRCVPLQIRGRWSVSTYLHREAYEYVCLCVR